MSGSPAVSVRARIDEARVPRAEIRITDAESLGDAAAEVLQHDVGLVDELPENLEAFGLLEIEEDAALAAVDVVVAQNGLHVRAVDADHVGAEFGERAATGGAGEDDAEVYDFDALKGGAEGCGCSPFDLPLP